MVELSDVLTLYVLNEVLDCGPTLFGVLEAEVHLQRVFLYEILLDGKVEVIEVRYFRSRL
jgi:hypothetical protein